MDKWKYKERYNSKLEIRLKIGVAYGKYEGDSFEMVWLYAEESD